MIPFPNTRTRRRTVYTLLLVLDGPTPALLQERETHLHGPSGDLGLLRNLVRAA